MKRSPEERAEAHLQKLRTRFEDPKIRRLWADRSARRRRLFLALFLVLLGTAALTSLALSQSTLTVLGSSLALLVVLIPLNITFQVLEAGSRTMHGYELVVDERQRAEIESARSLGHSITSALLILAVAIAGAAHLLSTNPAADHTVPIGVFLPVAYLVLVVHRYFPVAYLAWTQPDETSGD
ncbi:hypothetical protein GCM10007079_52530 [Nocardiopsis terrae]|uniref:Uncharacterized protein n=1 Tax=Nocardiopsis terrae TaxID=372655 RepID=A0ABR9HA23_9ACTN|nr:hypothetical protein [Nocardiopsis terrae]MBE1455877.1 hypothetical protein [Nocardiopsis terrae]GHC98311.1 hypothetical protein GCM10007079_52530 [Nocardiopsis terrae]